MNKKLIWEKLGRIISADKNFSWMATCTGPSFAVQINDTSLFDIYITGRDAHNRSQIGKAVLDIEDLQRPMRIQDLVVFDVGELGCFDENGVSYPVIVEHNGLRYMYYVGWVPTVLTPFQNFTGLATAPTGTDNFTRVSRAPILERTNAEPFSSGSVYVMQENGLWRMWYTSFLRWGGAGEHKHYYVIKYAESIDGIHWQRDGKICIDIENASEYAIGRPSVFKYNNQYYMWYVYRGDEYRIGFAMSDDGIEWKRMDHLAGIDVSKQRTWDSNAISYPHVFPHKDYLYMLYCGNDYGREGLGLARMALSNLTTCNESI